jgi:hypothetical protein
VPVQYLFDNRFGGCLGVQPRGQVTGFVPGLQGVDQLTPLAILLVFLREALQVVEAGRIQQAQAGEVTGLANLLRCRGEQQQAGGLLRQGLYK